MNNNVAVFGILPSIDTADRCLNQLRNAGFRNTDISVLMPEKTASKQTSSQDKRSKTQAENMAPAGRANANANAEGLSEWLASGSTVSIPGMGSFLAAGQVKAVLTGGSGGHDSASGGATAFVAGLTRFGIPEYDAKRYESQLKSGNILFAAHCDGIDWVNRAKEAFQNCGAEGVITSSELPAEYARAADQSSQRSYGATR
jgi:hypothetical protein